MSHTHAHKHRDSRKCRIVGEIADATEHGLIMWSWCRIEQGVARGYARTPLDRKSYTYYMHSRAVTESRHHVPGPRRLRQTDGAHTEHERLRALLISQLGPWRCPADLSPQERAWADQSMRECVDECCAVMVAGAAS